MAQSNNTISPTEEQKKPEPVQMPVYENASPIGTYYGEQGNGQADLMQRMINEWATKTDPNKQAEQDERTQRGREFWTGANLFANVIANAINAHGTANGAPNMTWNDASSQKMYETWQNADKELNADRRYAQQRLEALQMQDASMRAAGAEKRAAENKAVNDANFNIELENARYERGRRDAEQDWERKQAAAIEAEGRAFERKKELARINASSKGGKPSKQTTKNHDVQLGSIDIPANDEREAQRIRRDLANKIAERINADVDAWNSDPNNIRNPRERINSPKSDKEASKIIYQYGNIYDDDSDFRKKVNSDYGIDDIYDEQEGIKPHMTYPTVSKNGFGLVSPGQKKTDTQQQQKTQQNSPFDFSKL